MAGTRMEMRTKFLHRLGLWGLDVIAWARLSRNRDMARKLRVQYPGAVYHAMSRGGREVNVVIGEIVIDRVRLFRLALSLKKILQATVPVSVSAQPLNSVFAAGGIPLKPV
jgi:hypothetical protein